MSYDISVLKTIGELGCWIIVNKDNKILVQFPIKETEEAIRIFELLSAMMNDLRLNMKSLSE